MLSLTNKTILILTFILFIVQVNSKCGGWQTFSNFDYCIEKSILSFPAASESCKNINASLISIHSSNETNFVLNLFSNVSFNPEQAWIGYRKNDPLQGEFWTDNTLINYTNWADSQPDDGTIGKMESCGAIWINVKKVDSSTSNHYISGQWNDDRCSFQFPSVCKKRKDADFVVPTKTPVSSDGMNCDSDWIEFNGRCFKVFTEEVTFKEAEDRCNEMRFTTNGNETRSTLAAIRDSQDQQFIGSILWGVLNPWIGILYDFKQNVWSDDITEMQFTDGQNISGPNFVYVTNAYNFGDWQNKDSTHPYICMQYPHFDWKNTSESNSTNEIDCPELFLAFGHSCYFFSEKNSSYEDASENCQGMSDDNLTVNLVSLLNEPEINFVQFHISQYRIPFWIGLKNTESTDNDNVTRWTDGWPVLDPRFKNISNTNPSCTSLEPSNSKSIVSSQNCSKLLRYIYDDKAIPISQYLCPKNTIAGPSGCYRTANVSELPSTGPSPFYNAKLFCKEQNMFLAQFDSVAQLFSLINLPNLFHDLSGQLCSNSGLSINRVLYYIGLWKPKEKTELEWVSDGSKPDFSNWAHNQDPSVITDPSETFYVAVDDFGYWHIVTYDENSNDSYFEHSITFPNSQASTTTASTASTTSKASTSTSIASTSAQTSEGTTTSPEQTETSAPKSLTLGAIAALVLSFVALFVLTLIGYRNRSFVLSRMKRSYSQTRLTLSDQLDDDDTL